MSTTSKASLIEALDQSNAATRAVLKKTSLEQVVYENPAWLVRDVIWHIAVWDLQSARSILVFTDGGEYNIPDFDEDQFNTSSLEEGRGLTPEALLEQSQHAREAFQQAVSKVPDGSENSEFLYPWGDERGDVVTLVQYMVDHDEEHRQEIDKVINS